MDLAEIGAGIRRNLAETIALRERIDYLHVAVMRGDPRFAKAEYANPDFDTAAFDTDWARRGKRVPSLEEVGVA